MSDFVSPPQPPPSMSGVVAAKPGPVGWMAVVAGLLGLVGLVLPWYSPKLSHVPDGLTGIRSSPYHAWSGFFVLVVGPILLIVFGVLWLQALRGKPSSRFAASDDPTRLMSLQSVGAGLVALIAAILSFVLMTHAYKDWDATAKAARSVHATLEKNPQPGLYALLAGAVLLIVVGVVGLVTSGSATSSPAAAAAQEGFGATPGYYPPVNPPQS